MIVQLPAYAWIILCVGVLMNGLANIVMGWIILKRFEVEELRRKLEFRYGNSSIVIGRDYPHGWV